MSETIQQDFVKPLHVTVIITDDVCKINLIVSQGVTQEIRVPISQIHTNPRPIIPSIDEVEPNTSRMQIEKILRPRKVR